MVQLKSNSYSEISTGEGKKLRHEHNCVVDELDKQVICTMKLGAVWASVCDL